MRKNYFRTLLAMVVFAMTSLSASAQYKYASDCNMFKRAAITLDTWMTEGEGDNWDTSSNAIGSEANEDGSVYTVTLPVKTYKQWAAQYRFKTDLVAIGGNTYQFSVKLKANQTTPVILKEDTGSLYYEEVTLEPDEEKVVVFDAIAPEATVKDLQILFDFGGCEANTTVTITDIVFREADCDDDTYIYIPPTGPQVQINGTAFTQVGTSATEASFEGKLVQGKPYIFTGTDGSIVNGDDFYYNPDFFTKQADGSFTFNALTGNYHIDINTEYKFFQIYPIVEAEDGAIVPGIYENSGAMYVVGGTNFGKPSYEVNPCRWGTGMGAGLGTNNDWNPKAYNTPAAAEILKDYYRFTVTIGKQLGSGTGSDAYEFKFMESCQSWLNEMKQGTAETILMTKASELLTIGANIGQASALPEGKTYVIYFDRREETLAKWAMMLQDTTVGIYQIEEATDETGAGTEAAKLAADAYAAYVETGISTINAVEKANGAIYNLQGVRVAAPQKGLYIQNGKKYVVK